MHQRTVATQKRIFHTYNLYDNSITHQKEEKRREKLVKWGCNYHSYLFVRVDIDMTLDTLLSHVGPAIATHPFTLTLWAFILPKTPLLALVWSQTFPLWACLKQRVPSTLYNNFYLMNTVMNFATNTLNFINFQMFC